MTASRSKAARKTRGSIRRAASALGICAALVALSGGATAAPTTTSEVAVAEALFREAKELLAKGNYAEACPKLAESQRIDPAGGTIFALALCYEADGRTASAWVMFGEAKAVAERDKRADRVKSAKEHLASLEKRLSFLTVTVAKETLDLESLDLKRDDTSLGRATVGVAVAVDPGKHRITASAPGFKEISIEVEVGPSGDRRSVEIPALEKIEPPPPAPSVSASATPAPSMSASASATATAPLPTSSATPAVGPASSSAPDTSIPADSEGARRTAGLILIGTGLVSVTVGGIFGLRAKTQHEDATALCPQSPCSNSEGVSMNDSALTSARVADVTIGVGLAAFGVGLGLWLSAPRPAPRTQSASGPRLLSLAPAIYPGGAAATVTGTF